MYDPPDEMLEFALLERLSGYTRQTLAEEPAYVVQHWLMMIEAWNRAQKRQAEPARH